LIGPPNVDVAVVVAKSDPMYRACDEVAVIDVPSK